MESTNMYYRLENLYMKIVKLMNSLEYLYQ